MGYVRPAKTRKEKLPSNPHYFVVWRENVRYGDLKGATRAAVKLSATGESEVDAQLYADMVLLAYIAEWNLDDEAGNLLPLTPESLELLELEDSNHLATLAQKAQEGREKERKNS